MRIKIGEKLTEAEQKRRTESRVVPRRKHGGKEEWIPDFYTDTFAVKIEFPRYVPSDPKDRKKVADVYGRLRKHWKVYPESEHADAKHYASLLELGSD